MLRHASVISFEVTIKSVHLYGRGTDCNGRLPKTSHRQNTLRLITSLLLTLKPTHPETNPSIIFTNNSLIPIRSPKDNKQNMTHKIIHVLPLDAILHWFQSGTETLPQFLFNLLRKTIKTWEESLLLFGTLTKINQLLSEQSALIIAMKSNSSTSYSAQAFEV